MASLAHTLLPPDVGPESLAQCARCGNGKIFHQPTYRRIIRLSNGTVMVNDAKIPRWRKNKCDGFVPIGVVRAL